MPTREELNEQFLEAAKKGDAETVKVLVEAGANLEATDENDRTALIAAAGGGHTETALALVEAGADVNARDKHGETPLMYAADGRRGNTDIAWALIRAGADVNATDRHARSTLMWAVRESYGEGTARALARAGADLEYAADMLRRKGHGPETLGKLFALGAFAPNKRRLAACCREALKRLAQAQSGADETAALTEALQKLR